MKVFSKIVLGESRQLSSQKSSIIDVWQGPFNNSEDSNLTYFIYPSRFGNFILIASESEIF